MGYKTPKTTKIDLLDAVERLGEVVHETFLLPGPEQKIQQEIGKLRSLVKHLPEDE